MKIVEPGHIYELWDRLDKGGNQLVFFNNQDGLGHSGTTTQEVLRCLIDRVEHCNARLAHQNNDRILQHLRMALVLHESRALERKVEKGELLPETLPTGKDGHFMYKGQP